MPSEDYYREKEEDLECCYEFTESTTGTRYTNAYNEWGIGVPSGGPVTAILGILKVLLHRSIHLTQLTECLCHFGLKKM